MISICIPIYNNDVTSLISKLSVEIVKNKISAEIILIDDDSKMHYKEVNRKIKNDLVKYIELNQNIGISKIKNLFLQYANKDFLLFLDSDCKIIQDNFITQYLTFIIQNPKAQVICGGRVVEKSYTSAYNLRRKFSLERESKSAQERRKNPHLHFQGNNFMIAKSTFKETSFDERITKYGYEDVLLALQLKNKNIPISHIDNPELKQDFESNSDYLLKVEASVENIHSFLKENILPQEIKKIRLIKAFYFLKTYYLTSVFRIFFKFQKHRIKKLLLNREVNLKYLDIYKLGLLCEKTQF